MNRAAVTVEIRIGDDVVLRPVMWMFIAVLLTFLLTRFVTRRIRTKQRAAALAAANGDPTEAAGQGGLLKDINIGGIHLHHQVFGILLMAITGILVFATTPEGVGRNVAAFVFGIGLSLAFDEFALWLHLDDVYWSPEGRQSVDAIFCVLCMIGFLIGGADFISGEVGTGGWWASVASLLVLLALSVICLLKGKVMTGVIGVVFSPLTLVGTLRLAKPTSWWARRFYPPGSRRMRRSRRRFGPDYDRRWNRVRDFFAGAPDPQIAAPAPAGVDVPVAVVPPVLTSGAVHEIEPDDGLPPERPSLMATLMGPEHPAHPAHPEHRSDDDTNTARPGE
ncbi:hypothetical protein [Nakamurella alba]|uniref:hypothetical protein n=1 Tax=Nakamurella alba TaxID=2665158 RepID=UPI001E2BCCEF|nr:hypothetical protein [Nakamurella alba]